MSVSGPAGRFWTQSYYPLQTGTENDIALVTPSWFCINKNVRTFITSCFYCNFWNYYISLFGFH